MKKLILSVAAALLALGGLRAQETDRNAGESDWLTSYSALVVDAPLDIRLVRIPASEAPKIVYDTKGSDTKFRFTVKDRVLKITERPSSQRTDRSQVTLYYNELEQLTVYDASVTFADTLRRTLFDLSVGGNASLVMTMEVDDLKMELAGKSTVDLTGSARYLSLFATTGKLQASGLEVMSATVNAQSGADISLWVTDRFEGKTSTNASIRYKGTPVIVRGGTKFLGGDIRHLKE